MKLDQLQAISRQKKTPVMMMLALERMRAKSSRNVRGLGQHHRGGMNRSDLRSMQRTGWQNNPYGHIFSGVVSAEEKGRSGGTGVTAADVARRRAQNKVARRARAAARKRR